MVVRVVGAEWRRALAIACLLVATHAAAQPAGESPAPATAAPYAILFGSLRTTGAPAVVTNVAKGGDLLTVPVTYAVTGVLRDEVKGPWLSIIHRPPVIPAGTPLFAIPSSHPTGVASHPELLWCAVQIETGEEPPRWNITCFPKVTRGWVAFAPVGQDIFPAFFAFHYLDQTAAPDIQEQPVELSPPLALVIQFAGWKDNLAELRVVVRQPQHTPFGGQPAPGDQTLAHQRLPRDATGAAHLPAFGGEILVRPGPDGKSATVEIAKPFLIGLAQR